MGPPYPFNSRSTRLSCSSTATHSASSDGHRNIHRKENQFIYRYGSKLHAYDRDKAPYPLSFDRDVVELQCLDNAFMLNNLRGMSFVDWEGKPLPKRCLDIGTGLGMWIISVAKQWPETTFVGLDMVNIQIPLQVLESDVADRIEWVHTNILRNKLPFDDEEFDYVHINKISCGIPENKWYPLYEEIRRVMKPGGTIEHLEEDAIFPTLPRWYTNPLRAHSRGLSTATPGVQSRLSIHQSSDTSDLKHEHELLETLFDDLFSNRFINSTPTSILPGYFGAFFDRMLSPPVIHCVTPPLAPFAPIAGLADHMVSHPSCPMQGHTNGGRPSIPHNNGFLSPHADEFLSGPLTPSQSSILHVFENGSKGDKSLSPSRSSLHVEPSDDQLLSRRASNAPSVISMASQADSHSSGSRSSKSVKRPSFMLLASPGEGTSIGGDIAVDLIPMDKLDQADEQMQYMHLYHAVTWVLATKEAMWDELLVRVHAHDENLRKFGWHDEDYNEQASRTRFEAAIDLYQSDMRGRISLWNTAIQNGWHMPVRDPATKAEIAEEIQLRRDIIEAKRLADTGEPEPPCRKVRILIGSKES